MVMQAARQDSFGPLPPGALLRVRHRPLHGVPAPRGAEALPGDAPHHVHHIDGEGRQDAAHAESQARVHQVPAKDPRRDGADESGTQFKIVMR